MWSPKVKFCAGCLNAPLPCCAAGAEWTLTLVDSPADLNLYMAADARILIFRGRARDHLDTGYLCRARRSCRITRRCGGAQAANRDDDRPDIRSLSHLDKRDRAPPSFEGAQSRRLA